MTGRSPTNTYRLQLTADFDLFEAARRLPYLRDLGVDWVYLSPILAAEPGSRHGYDVVAHDRLDESRGGREGLAALSAAARRLGLGVLVDIVPNHVGVATPAECRCWWQLLRDGRESRAARFFDVDWAAGGGRIRIPIVGDDDLLPGGRIAHLAVVDGELRYHDHRHPIAPGTGDGDADDVHARQHYELVSWRRADAELNYRRFFAVNTLAAVRVEDPHVFEQTHVEIRRWFDEGLVDGLRVDHPDGLRDPRAYLDDLARLTGGTYVLVEKILEPGEHLPRSWATAGTTGYDVLGHIDRVLTDPAGQPALDTLEAGLRGAPMDWAAMVHDRKRDVADGILQSEVRRIVREVVGSTGSDRDDRDEWSQEALRDAVAELLACFPVYRSYLPEGRDHLDQAFSRARDRRPELTAVFDLLEPILGDPAADPARRFQQTSGMVMAKGVEDCAFYRFSRLTSLNEVGGDPDVFALAPSTFHELMVLRQREWPRAMTALSTHDTKRGEDVRARIAVLAEIPDEWSRALEELLELVPVPDAGFGSLLWQAVLGAWPASRGRLHAYAEKAMREAADHTTWTDPDEDYETVVHAAVDAAFDDPRALDVLNRLLERVAPAGWSNALAAKLLGLTVPGVPDVYQGSELWEQSLVDPDNRRPVDLDLPAQLLDDLRAGATAPPTIDELGSVKLRVVHSALSMRRDRPGLFTTYCPLEVTGPAADHALAFDRGGAVTVVTRLPVGLARRGGWGDTRLRLPPGRWGSVLDALDGAAGLAGEVLLADLMTELPVALLVEEDA